MSFFLYIDEDEDKSIDENMHGPALWSALYFSTVQD